MNIKNLSDSHIESHITGMDIFPIIPKTPITLPEFAAETKKNKKST